ncbi:Zinc finger protein 26 [Cyphomyrmex costatus]|uniref:Zinc finger protein 26 n=1 Tax=Cyphomyrmex costatus TaxID=456900 RepID=A0A195CAD0_9HYME|nr:Zinc finger protein 26 [Cyphomyrmex costatus]
MDAVAIRTSSPPQGEDAIASAMKICRVCLLDNLMMRDLFAESEVASLSAKAMSFANVKMLPGDGLPTQVCCMCADKLESAYELKLQVEQANNVLREKFMGRMKDDLFLNEVDMHLHAEKNNGLEEINDSADYGSTGTLPVETETDKNFLKNQLIILEAEKLAETGEMQQDAEQDSLQESIEEQLQQELASSEGNDISDAIDESRDEVLSDEKNIQNCTDTVSTEGHNFIMQQQCIIFHTDQFSFHKKIQEEDVSELKHDTVKYEESLSEQNQENHQAKQNQNDEMELLQTEVSKDDTNDETSVPVVRQELPQNETRRSKRLARRTLAERDSDEENYFENLNLSSRLKKAQANKAEKFFFICYLCDEQFLSKCVLKQHMQSHEEVRRTLSVKKMLKKSRTCLPVVPTPSSGRKANKCPYCGKEYQYIISFNKHIKQHEREHLKTIPLAKHGKQHEREQQETNEDPIFIEISFEGEEHNLDSDNDNKSNVECEKRKRESTAVASDNDQNKRKKFNLIEEFTYDKCPEKFDTKQGLQNHSLTHVNFTCSVCDEEYETLEQLKNHRTKHVIQDIFTEQDLEEDMKQMAQNIKDNNENTKNIKSTENKKALSRHIETTQSYSYKCKICYQKFTRKDFLRRHAEQHARLKNYKCTQCNKSFGNELTLRNHLIATNHKTFIQGQEYDPNKRIKRMAATAAQKIIDKIKIEDGLEDYDDDDDDNTEYDFTQLDRYYQRKRSAKEFVCATCNKNFNSKQALTKHMEQHVKEEKAEKTVEKQKNKGDNNDDSDFESGLDWPMDNHECTTCKKKYSTKKSLLRHQLLHEEPNFECDICNVKFYRKDKLKVHYDKCSEKNPNQVRKCNICGDSFENNKILREHRIKHVTEGILTEEDLIDIEPEEKRIRDRMPRKRRTDIVGLECVECKKRYTSRKGLLRHIQIHEGKKYLCEMCPKKFYRREHLKIHVAKHNMIKPYKCTRCSKRFIKEEQLNNHLPKHDRTFKKNKEADSSKRFLCEICSKSFTQSTTLIAHLRAHKGIKPFVCEVCSRPFTTNAYLKMHMRTHTQERPYICQYCSRAFARADTLANHLTSHTGEAKYHCKCCPKNFRRLKSLKEHMFIHTGQRPYECPTCDRKFNNNGSRYAHSKRCKQNLLQNQNRAQQVIQQTQQQSQQQHQQQEHQPQQVQIHVQQSEPHPVRLHQTTIGQAQVIKTQNIKTIAIARQADPTITTTQQVVQHQEILMPLILPLTVTLADVGEEVILPEGTKIFTTS